MQSANQVAKSRTGDTGLKSDCCVDCCWFRESSESLLATLGVGLSKEEKEVSIWDDLRLGL